jgi:hypothetical protein
MSLCLVSSSVFASSAVYTGVAPFHAIDLGGDWLASFDVFPDGRIVGLVGRSINLYSPAGAYVKTLGTVPDYSAGKAWASFTRLNPDGSEVWVGYTMPDYSNDRIYSVSTSADNAAAAWRATLAGNWDLEWTKVAGVYKPFATGLNNLGYGQNSVWMLDTAGTSHKLVARIGSYGSGLAFDPAGNLYALQYENQTLCRFSAASVKSVIDNVASPMSCANADFWTRTRGGGSDVTTDSAGHVFFNANTFGGASIVGVLDPGLAGDYRYDNVATGAGWTSFLSARGAADVMLGQGHLYISDWYAPGVTMLAVPEPGTAALLSLGVMALGAFVRRRRGEGK